MTLYTTSELDTLHITASALLGQKIHCLTRSGNGGNSRIYRVEAGGEYYALKIYPVIANDTRDRLTVEKKTLQLFERNNISPVPRWINDSEGHALLSWVEGVPVPSPAERDINEAVAFLAAIKNLSITAQAQEMPDASEACVSGKEVVRQIERRLMRLQEPAKNDAMLEAFLSRDVMHAFEKAVQYAKAQYQKQRLDFEAPLQIGRCLIPADFGFHNALRTADGTLAFLDFEYFGWDDPVKLTADFLLHPAMELSDALRAHFTAKMLEIHASDAHFALRLRALTPLFALRWVLILLNEFLPERWRARSLAQGEHAWAEAKDRQMKKARFMLENVYFVQ